MVEKIKLDLPPSKYLWSTVKLRSHIGLMAIYSSITIALFSVLLTVRIQLTLVAIL